MPSFLAQQLQKIATVSRQGQVVAGPKTTKQKPSFLFDAKKAADLDIDTIFSLGISGLAELKALDSRFENFEETLFSERLKGFDRALQTKEDNDRVDKSIQSFLRLLSPYFLEKGAGKALEWLVRRFRYGRVFHLFLFRRSRFTNLFIYIIESTNSTSIM